jgi:hypothetical protein
MKNRSKFYVLQYQAQRLCEISLNDFEILMEFKSQIKRLIVEKFDLKDVHWLATYLDPGLGVGTLLIFNFVSFSFSLTKFLKFTFRFR